MKYIIYIIVGVSSLFMASCTIESISNGKLDGFWHLEHVDTLATGGTADLSGQKRFWAFAGRLVHMQGAEQGFYCRFTHSDNTLIINKPHLDQWHEDNPEVEQGGDIPVADPSVLNSYGIQTLDERFTVETLGGSRMVLKSNVLRLHFRKF